MRVFLAKAFSGCDLRLVPKFSFATKKRRLALLEMRCAPRSGAFAGPVSH
jgi:hypothetical protein